MRSHCCLSVIWLLPSTANKSLGAQQDYAEVSRDLLNEN